MRPAVLALIAGCGRIAFDPVATGDGGLGSGDGSTGACTEPFGAPQVATSLNSLDIDWAPEESADGLTLYFGSGRNGGDVDMYRATRAARGDAWGAPAAIPELTQTGPEEDNPTLSPDELEMYFGRTSLSRVSRTSRTQAFGNRTVIIPDGGAFTMPQGPFLSADGLSLYFTAIIGPNYDIYVITRANRTAMFNPANAVEVGGVNSADENGWPYLTDDELTMYFTSAFGGDLDLWMATRPSKTAAFSGLTQLTALNSTMGEYDPFISSDGTTLWFSSNRVNGAFDYDLYFATRTCP